MKKIFNVILIITLFTVYASCKKEEVQRNILPPSHFDFTETDNFLKKYVVDGKVKYAEVKNDDALNKLTQQLKTFEPYTIEDGNERLAFWINVYNLYTIKLVSDYYPVNSILDIEEKINISPWSYKFIEMAGERKFSLDEIEKEIIIPEFEEPRIHYALVCAAESCPVIISEAYLPATLDQQLDRQASIFLNDKSKNYLDRKNNMMNISMIYKWYKRDFINKDTTVIKHIEKYINESDKEYLITNNINETNYLDYSWKLNDYKKSE